MSGTGDELADVTNSLNRVNVNAAAIERVKGAHWNAPQKYNYDAYNADSKEKRQAIEAVQEVPAWAANAVKYEWSEEYGDVGPQFEELEKVLFGDENQMKTGEHFSK